jgi:hypothetical protein
MDDQSLLTEQPLPATSGVGPDLTVVIVSAAGGATLHRTLAAIAAQTIAPRIEVLAVTPDPSDEVGTRVARLTATLHSFRALSVDSVPNVDFAAGRVILDGTAPIVSSIEDHAFPEPEWAENILSAFADPAVVAAGSAFVNANPQSGMSWGTMLIALGPWNPRVKPGRIDWIQLHDCTYRRAALEPLGPDLWALFNRESDVLLRLKAADGAFAFVPAARVRHLNPSQFVGCAKLRINAGRLAAAGRWTSEKWGPLRRAIYVLGSPAIPLVRYVKLRKNVFGNHPGGSELRAGWAVFYGLVFDAIGQAIGFAAGPGAARDALAGHELDRTQELNPADSRRFAPVEI